MTIKFILRYFADSHKKLKKISEKGDGNIFYLWYDFIKCSIIHAAIINHYMRTQKIHDLSPDINSVLKNEQP